MMAIPIDDLRGKGTVAVNLYLRLSDSKHVLWLKAGTPASLEMVEKLRAKGVDTLYIANEDYRTYVASNISIASSQVDSRQTSAPEKLALLQRASMGVLQEIESLGLSREIFIHAKMSTEVVSVLAEVHPEFLQFIEQMGTRKTSLVDHALSVSIISTMIGLQMGWSHPQVLEKLALGGFLHDIGMLRLPRDIQDKPVEKMKHDDLILYHGHCEVGREMLRGLAFIPEDVVAVVYQHHELSNGTGFPSRLVDSQINPLARVVALANAFCEHTFKDPQQPRQLSVQAVLNYIENEMGQPFNAEAFAALRQLVAKGKGQKTA